MTQSIASKWKACRARFLPTLLLAMLFGSGCTPTVTVRYKPTVDRALVAEVAESDPQRELIAAYESLTRNPGNPVAVASYNSVLEAYLVGLDRKEVPVEELANVDLSNLPDRYRKNLTAIVPADALHIEGLDYRYFRAGAGIPLVAILEPPPDSAGSQFYVDRRVKVPVTAVFTDSEGGRPAWRLYAPTRTETVSLSGTEVPLAADFTSPWAYEINGFNDLLLGIIGLFGINVPDARSGVYLTEPYDPNRIPIFMVHGLGSSPIIWRNIANAIKADPELQRRYQVWVVYYRSGMPIPQSGAVVRNFYESVLDEFDPPRSHPASQDTIWIGHSMGGVLTHASAKDVGDRLWAQLSNTPFDEVEFSEETRQEIRPWIFWEPVPALSRAIFFSTPHRGAEMADSSIGNLGKRLIRLPLDLIRVQYDFIKNAYDDLRFDARQPNSFNSISSLSPKAPIYTALAESPWKPGFQYHTVVGTQGNPDLEHSTDGVVAYWSSHLEGAETELAVPTGHNSFEHPDAIAETLEILRNH